MRFLPPYSPDLNPIEKMWSKIKQILRSIKARTQDALLAAIAAALECVSKEDALGWFASCGYALN
jgi:transposase